MLCVSCASTSMCLTTATPQIPPTINAIRTIIVFQRMTFILFCSSVPSATKSRTKCRRCLAIYFGFHSNMSRVRRKASKRLTARYRPTISPNLRLKSQEFREQTNARKPETSPVIPAATRSPAKRTVRNFVSSIFPTFQASRRPVSRLTHEPYTARSRIGPPVSCVVDGCPRDHFFPHWTDASLKTALDPYTFVEVRSEVLRLCSGHSADSLALGGLCVWVIVGIRTRTSERILASALWNPCDYGNPGGQTAVFPWEMVSHVDGIVRGGRWRRRCPNEGTSVSEILIHELRTS